MAKGAGGALTGGRGGRGRSNQTAAAPAAKPATAQVEAVARQMAKAGVMITTKAETAAKSTTGGKWRAATDGPDLQKRILKTFLAEDRAGSSGHGKNVNYVLLSTLRDKMPNVSRQAFDGAVNALRRRKLVSLDAADGRHVRLARSAIEGGIVEEGKTLPYMKIRGRRATFG